MKALGENRAAVRFRQQCPVRVMWGGHEAAGRVLDVSFGGVAVECECDLEIGAEVRLDFSCGQRQLAEPVTARVRNRRGTVLGMEYVPRSVTECKSLDWIDGLLSSSGYQLAPSSSAEPAVWVKVMTSAAGIAAGALVGWCFDHGAWASGVGSATGLLVSYAACTI